MNRSRPNNVRLDDATVTYRMKELGLSRTDVCRKANIGERTLHRVMKGASCQIATARQIASVLKIELTELLFDNKPKSSKVEQSDWPKEWEAVEVSTPLMTASNGLQFQIHKLRHRMLDGVYARGKRYETQSIACDDEEAVNKYLFTRHAQICKSLEKSTYLPTNLSVSESEDATYIYVIDSWPNGDSLSGLLNSNPTELVAAEIAVELGNALQVLHDTQVVLRDLHPTKVFWEPSTSRLQIVDLEMAKLFDGSPTVNSGELIPNPFRAPECAGHNFDQTADVYSWAAIVVFLVSGATPAILVDGVLRELPVPRAVRGLLADCLNTSYRKRPSEFADILPEVQKWMNKEMAGR